MEMGEVGSAIYSLYLTRMIVVSNLNLNRIQFIILASVVLSTEFYKFDGLVLLHVKVFCFRNQKYEKKRFLYTIPERR